MEFKAIHLALLGIKPQYMWEEIKKKDLMTSERIVDETISNLREIGRLSHKVKEITDKILREAGIILNEFTQEVKERRKRQAEHARVRKYDELEDGGDMQERIKRLVGEIPAEVREAMEREEVIEEERRNEKTGCTYCDDSRDEINYYKERNKRLEKENEKLKKENEKLKKELAKYTLFEEDTDSN